MRVSNSGRFTFGRRKGVRLQADGPGGGGGIAYLLLDQFTTPLPAGSVNGTAADPGPGTRTVTDTNNKLSITGGVASFATGGVSQGNPGLWYPSQSRQFGKALLAAVNRASGVNSFDAGWDFDSSGGINDGLRFSSSGVLSAVVLSNAVVVGAFSNGTVYSVAVVMRSTGMYYFVKGGAFAIWTLVWQSALTNSAMLPGAVVNGTDVAVTADNVRVPVSLYTVPQLAYDTFTRSNGALGSTETAGADAQVVTARAWTLQAGTIVVASNAASLTVLSGALNAIATTDEGVADVMVDVNVTRTLLSGGSVIRYADANNYLRASHDGTNALIEQVVAGTPTTLRTGAATYSAGATLRVIVSGTTGMLFYNGAAVGASFTVPASSATLHGLYGLDLSCVWDNFQVMSRGVDGAYAGLDAF